MNYQKLLNKIIYKNSIFIEVVSMRGFVEYYQKKTKRWGKISKPVFEGVWKLSKINYKNKQKG